MVQTLNGKVNCGTVTSAAGCRKVQSAGHGICHTGGPRQHHSSSCGWLDEWMMSTGEIWNVSMKICACGPLSTTSHQWTGGGAWPEAVTTPRAWRQPLTAVWSDRRTISGMYCYTVSQAGRFVSPGSCRSWNDVQLFETPPVSHSLNATTLAAASLNPKGNSVRTQKAVALLSHRQTGPQACKLLSETSPLLSVMSRLHISCQWQVLLLGQWGHKVGRRTVVPSMSF
jgi:hypothetical protein